MRYFYLKQSNAVAEAERVLAAPDRLKVGGSDTFLAHFLEVATGNAKLVLSLHTAPERDEEMQVRRLRIKSYFWYSTGIEKLRDVFWKAPFALGRRTWVSASIFMRIMRFSPDRVICWASGSPLWACYLGARLNGATFVISRHTRFPLPDEPWFRRITGWVGKAIMRRADAIVVHGPYLVDEAKATGADPDRIIEFDCTYPPGSAWNSAGLEETDGTRMPRKEGKWEIMFLGRVEKKKGALDLLDAAEPLLKRHRHVRLVYAGGGDAAGELAARVRKYGLEGQVTFLGTVPHEKLPTRIKEAGVVVTPTPRKYPEGRCMAAMEALVAGRPVIAPRSGPFPYLVQHEKNGLLYEPDSIVSLREVLARLIGESDLHSQLIEGARDSSSALCAHEFSYYAALKQAFDR